ncbi:C-C motif chemokine 20-like [Scyliorhinus torazame]
MRFPVFTFTLMAACFYLSTSQANSFEDCCLQYYKGAHTSRLQKRIVSYYEQTTGGGCNLHAIVLKLRRVTLCMNPNVPWVKYYIKRDRKHGRRCRDISRPCKHRNTH